MPTPGQASGEQPALRRRVRQASESLDIHQLPISQESSGLRPSALSTPSDSLSHLPVLSSVLQLESSPESLH